MNYDSITKIDIHGMRPEEAVKTLSRLIDGAPDTVYRIRVIHGYHRGTSLRSMIQYEYRYHSKVLRIMPGDNPGVTIPVLKELY